MRFVLVVGFAFAAMPPLAATQAQTEGERLVFAHYMLFQSLFSRGQADLVREVELAAELGIDGFQLNFGAPRRPLAEFAKTAQGETLDRLFAAAAQVSAERGQPFYLFLSPDFNPRGRFSWTQDDLLWIFERYRDHPQYFRPEGRPLLTPWAFVNDRGEEVIDAAWWQAFKERSGPVVLMPFLGVKLLRDGPSAEVLEVVDGLYSFGVGCARPGDCRRAPEGRAIGDRTATLAADHDKLFMAGLNYSFWQACKAVPRVNFLGLRGPEAYIAHWQHIITEQRPDWVDLTTWNDHGEDMHLHPLADPPEYPHPSPRWTREAVPAAPKTGVAPLTAYFIDWFKHGEPPAAPEFLTIHFNRRSLEAPAPMTVDGCTTPQPRMDGVIADSVTLLALLRHPLEITVAYRRADGSHERLALTMTPEGADCAARGCLTQLALPWQAGTLELQAQRGEALLGAFTTTLFDHQSPPDFAMHAHAIPLTVQP